MKYRDDQSSGSERNLPINCFKRSEGCIHLEYGNIIFSFTQSQFRALAEVVGKVHRDLESEGAEK